MPRSINTYQIQTQEKRNSGHCRIRKRVSSSSSSSSAVKNYRFKRAILVGKKTGPSTPVLIMAGSRSPMQNFENGVRYGKDCMNHGNNVKGKEALSARKLAATLWEINGMHSPSRVNKDEIFEERRGRRSSDNKVGKLFDGEQHLLLDQQHPLSPACEKIDGSKVGSHRRRSSGTSQKLQITEYMAGGLEAVGRPSSDKVSNHVSAENNLNIKSRLKDVGNSLIASKELVKVLYRIMSHEEEQSSRLTLVSALRVELDRARLQVDLLVQEQRYNCNQMDALLKQYAEEKASWKSKEKHRIREAISSIAKELEIERKLRRQAERLNKKLGIELADTRADLSRALKELDGERRAREILEQTCDELARGIGEERVEVEELIRESAKAREEVEKERQMLQLADVLREERVQMKLSEARYEFEEKSAALERLKSDIQSYMKNEPNKEIGDALPYFDGIVDFDEFLKRMQSGSFQEGERDRGLSDVEVDDGGKDDSSDSELHSIELSMDNKFFKWNFANEGNNQGDSRRASLDEVFKGRRSLSEKIQWESICLQKKASDGTEWEFSGNKKQGSANGFDKEKPLELCANGENNDHHDDLKRFKPVKSQKFPSYQDPGSPAMSTGKTSSLRAACSAILQDLAARKEQLEGQHMGIKG